MRNSFASIREMPRKIGFIVVNSSSHEDNYSANELMVHAPTANGWRSSRLCSYPQHITLQLVELCRVRKLQLLAHQYLIPTKVEFHIGNILPETSTPGFPGTLRRLGYVSLLDNEETGFKSRELKSVHVDAIGTYLKITFHSNHDNHYNQYNQVALVAINVLGDPLDGSAFHTMPSREQLIEQYLNSTQLESAMDTTFMGKCESVSPFDDLAFDMYHDPEVARIIRLLDQKKQEMVRQEKYEHAQNLKQAIADLQKVGERLARYDVEKQRALEKEDYDLAKKKKELMEEYRSSVYKQLEVHNLLDISMITNAAESTAAQDCHSLQPSPGHPSIPAKHLVSKDTLSYEKKTNTPQSQQSDTGIVASKLSSKPHTPCTPSVSKTDVTGLPFDETPLPVIQRKGRPLEPTHSPGEQHSPRCDAQRTPNITEMSGELEPLPEKARREAGLPIDVYGESLVAGIYSKTWSYREDALLALHKKLLELSPTTPKEALRNIIRAAVFLIKNTLLDKVSPVFQASLKLLRLLLGQLILGLGLGRTELTHCFEQTWPNLLARTGESITHVRTMATDFIQEIAVLKDVRSLQVIPTELVKLFKSNYPCRLAVTRVELLERLLAELGIEHSGFTLRNIIMFCTAVLEHSSPVVREMAVGIIFSMYEQHRAAVLDYLPPNNAATRKTFLYKTIFDGFANIDGKLLGTDPLEKGGPQQDGQKQEEIHSHQEQLAAMKEITERGNEGTKGKMLKKEALKVEKELQNPGKVPTKVPQEKKTDNTDAQQSTNYLDNLCIFCGKKDESFTEDGLDLHYWKHCPMLRRCEECRQVVELESLTEHLLGECESRSKFSKCSHCSEAVATEDLGRHIQSQACNPPSSSKGSNHCPLCHSNFMPGEEAWKAHLMGREGCKQNSRRTVVSQRTQPAQGRARGGAKLKQVWSVGARARPKGRGSRIPALTPLSRGHTAGKH